MASQSSDPFSFTFKMDNFRFYKSPKRQSKPINIRLACLGEFCIHLAQKQRYNTSPRAMRDGDL